MRGPVNVFDASALLSFLQGKEGSPLVESALVGGTAMCGAANWSETAQKIRGHGRDWSLARALLLSYGIVIEPVTLDDAERAAERWRPGQSLSLADRLCLALADRTDATVITADRTWGSGGRIRQIR